MPTIFLRSILVLAICAFSSAEGRLAVASADSPDATTLLRQALELEQQGHTSLALQLYREASLLKPNSAAPRVGIARVYLSQDELSSAEAILQPVVAPLLLLRRDELKKKSRAEAEALRIFGEALYRTERLKEAQRAWEHSLSIQNDQLVRQKLSGLQRETEWTEGYQGGYSARFILRYEGQAELKIERQLLQNLEAQYDEFRRLLGGAPQSPIVVVLYPSNDFHEATLAPRRAVGLYDGKIRIPSRNLNLSNSQFQRTLRHELTHAFIHALGGEAVPRWLHEGLAEHMEGEVLGDREKLLAQEYVRTREKGWGEGFSYAMSLSLVNHMIDRAGLQAMGRLLAALKTTSDIDQALMTQYGRDHKELTLEWGKALEEKYL